MQRFTFFLILIFITSSLSLATDWYVRPVGGSYGAENGTSYSNAWDGLLNVVWGPGGVQPGDTLYVCGLHVYTMTGKGNLVAQADINPISGLNDSTRITIRGDYQGDPGIVWGAYLMNYESWVNEGSNTYSINLPGDSYRGNFFEDIGIPNNGSYTLLKYKTSIAEVNSTPGSYYSPDYEGGSKLYVHCSDSGDPTGRIYGNNFGYEFILNDQSYITFSNIKFFCRRWREQRNASHIRWRNCIIWYGEAQLFEFRDGQHYMEIIGCNLAYASTIIYNISGTNNAPSHYIYSRNVIHKAGYLDYHRAHGDRHGLGLQGGDGGLVESNEIYDCHDGIVFYVYGDQNLKNMTIRYNYIHDLIVMSGVGSGRHGIVFGAPANAALGDVSGNRVHHNIITDCDIGIKHKLPDEVEIFNNVVYGATLRSFTFSASYPGGKGTKTNFKNNISYNPRGYHIVIGTDASPGANEFYIESDHNLFYPNTGEKFLYYDGVGYIGEMNFSGWQSIKRTNCSFDPNGLAADPKFTNESSSYSNEADFQLQSDSPSIDTGVDIGLTQDYKGTSVPLGFAPDIGAFECIKPIYIKISASPSSGDIPLTVLFTGSALGDNPPFNFNWNFGDGSTSNEQNPSHTFNDPGNYTSILTVTDSHNNTETGKLSISVYDPIKQLEINSTTGAPAPDVGGTTNPEPGIYLYDRGTAISLDALPNSDYRFSKWNGDVISEDIYKKKINVIMDVDKSVSAYFCTKCGDVNGDLIITPSDAQMTFDIFLGKLATPTQCQKENADVNCDGTKDLPNITPSDAQLIFEKYLGQNQFPCDCTGGSRTKIMVEKESQISGISLILNDMKVKKGNEIIVPVITTTASSIKSFGFDLFFQSDLFEFIKVERSGISENFDQIEAHEMASGMLRVGGYNRSPRVSVSSETLVLLIFRAISDMEVLPLFSISDAFDDIMMPSSEKKARQKRLK